MPLELVAQYFALRTRYLYDLAQFHSHWMIIPTLLVDGRYQVALLNPDGDWHPYPPESAYRNVASAVEVGKRTVDLWMAELEAEG